MKSDSKMIKNTFIYLPAYLLPRLSSFAVIIFGTRLLSPAEFGYFSLVILIGEFCDVVLTNWARIAIARFGTQDTGVSRQFVMRMARLMCATTLVSLMCAITICATLAPERLFDVGLGVTAYVISSAFLRFGIRLNQVTERNKIASFLEAIRAAAYLSVTLGSMSLHPANFLFASLSGCLVTAMVGVFAYHAGTRRLVDGLPNAYDWGTILRFSWPLIVLTLLGQLVTSLDKALIKSFYDSSALGMYVAAFTVGRTAFDVIGASFNTGAFVKLSSLYNSGRLDEVRDSLAQQLALLVSIFLPGAVLLISTVDVIAKAFFREEFGATFAVVVPIVVIGAVAINIKFYIYDNVYHLFLKNIRQIATLLIGFLVSITIGLIFIPRYPEGGAALMFSAGGVSSLVMSVLLSRKYVKITVLAWPFASSAGIALLCYVFATLIENWSGHLPLWAQVVALGCMGVVFVAVSLLICLAMLPTSHANRIGNEAPRYAFVANQLRHGGIEAVVVALCNTMIRSGVDVTLVLRRKNGPYVAELDPRLRVVELGSDSMLSCMPRLIRLMYNEKFDVVVSGGDQQNIAICLIKFLPRLRTRFIITEHNNPILSGKAARSLKTRIGRAFRSVLYPHVDHIVAVSDGVRSALLDSFGCQADKVTTIYNPIPLEKIGILSQQSPDHLWLTDKSIPVILAVGRLHQAKDFGTLLLAFSKFLSHQPARLIILGDGPERSSLEAKVRELGIGDFVDLPGFSLNPYSFMSRSDLFVLSSRWEGFAVVVAEALACGLPVVATDCPSGPAEILENGKFGLLVPVADAEAMSEAMLRSIAETQHQYHLKERAADFAAEISGERYLALMKRFTS